MNNQYRVNKEDIAHSFSRAAITYDSVASLQRRIGRRLLYVVPKRDYESILDLGCGTGYFGRQLLQRFAASQVLGLDMAEGMVNFARQQHDAPDLQWCCADAESLPLADASVSLLFSNLALQWCRDLSRVMAEAKRVLRPGGCFAFSTLGPDTLHELKAAWRQVDRYVHVNSFLDLSEIRSAALTAGFDCRASEERVVVEYRRLRELTQELKGLGAHNLNRGRPTGLTGKRRIQKLLEAYEGFRDQQGKLPATYQTYYCLLFK